MIECAQKRHESTLTAAQVNLYRPKGKMSKSWNNHRKVLEPNPNPPNPQRAIPLKELTDLVFNFIDMDGSGDIE